MQQLQPNTLLQGGKYKIERVLGQGGFGITYLAEQVMLGRKVAVKEFFMKELCERNDATSFVTLGTESGRDTVNRFRDKFLKEARNIARLNHPHIVRIIDVFEENGTAYYVMEYAENGSLADKVKKEGYLSEPIATQNIQQVADALDYVHQRKMNHLDVKPANIMLNDNGDAVLIDFGLSKQYDAVTGNQTSTTPVGISEGYAPMEQYKQGGVGEFSPETDIYALGATFYKLLTGITPPSASDVMEDGLSVDILKSKGVSDYTIAVICKAMESRKKDRMRNVKDFISNLGNNAFSATIESGNKIQQEEDSTEEETTVIIEQESENQNEQKGDCDKDYMEVQSYFEDEESFWSRLSLKWIIIAVVIIFICVCLGISSQKTKTKESPIETVNNIKDDSTKIIIKGGHIESFDIIDDMPSFPGGTSKLEEYLSNNIHYPEICEKQGIQGTVKCSFTVGVDGGISNVQVVWPIHELLDNEAVRVIKSMPKWIPGKHRGRKVRVKLILPITYRLE